MLARNTDLDVDVGTAGQCLDDWSHLNRFRTCAKYNKKFGLTHVAPASGLSSTNGARRQLATVKRGTRVRQSHRNGESSHRIASDAPVRLAQMCADRRRNQLIVLRRDSLPKIGEVLLFNFVRRQKADVMLDFFNVSV